MAEIKEFVVNDRRKFTAEGEARPDAPPSEPKPARPEASLEPTSDEKYGSSAHLVDNKSTPISQPEAASDADEPPPPPPLTEEQINEVKRAFDATIDRIDTAIRATNPGMDRLPEMTFDRVIQSLYMQAIIQLGGAAEPGQKPQVDVLGARQTIEMLTVLADKSQGNLTEGESSLMENALFELRMGFLEITQALARQAQAKQGGPGAPGMPPIPGAGPSIVR
jgi:hypothetical protein